MGPQSHKSKKKVKSRKKGHLPKNAKSKYHKKYHKKYHARPSKIFHDNCCMYKVRPRPLRFNQVDFGTQCPSRTHTTPLIQHPIRSKVVRLPETLVMHMRNIEEAHRMAGSFRNTLIRALVLVPDIVEGDSMHQVDLRPRHVERRDRKRPSCSEMDLVNSFERG
ncbi:uncharacterized protein LOC128255522 isoform X2 [Drosophila gunungcola]|nr:uncharacterized protein LOC128255522 isoform X2 [Drosophila gunungcola]